MGSKNKERIECRAVELDGIRYVILREAVFTDLCQKAGVVGSGLANGDEAAEADGGMDQTSLAKRLVRRRRMAGLSQAELSRRAGVRSETLNRIERGRTTPDFATVRKLVVALNAAELQQANHSNPAPIPTTKES